MKFNSPIPILRSFDELKAKEFYVDFLGFTIDWDHRFEENTPLYMQLSKGDCIIHLSEHHGDSSAGASLRIITFDLGSYQTELLAKKYKNSRPGIQVMPWGTQ
ncbi:MAG: glyoxalase superfamily protein, partial [Methylococcales bacterium]